MITDGKTGFMQKILNLVIADCSDLRRFDFRKRPRDRSILFTRDNIRLDREIIFDDDVACAYIEVWFDAERKFGIRLTGDDYVNVYAYITPVTGEVRVTYVSHRCDGSVDNECQYTGLAESEKDLIRKMADETSLKGSGMTLDSAWFDISSSDCFD